MKNASYLVLCISTITKKKEGNLHVHIACLLCNFFFVVPTFSVSIFWLHYVKMLRVKQVAQKITIMEKFASLDAETCYDELYSERTFLAKLGFILTGEAPY